MDYLIRRGTKVLVDLDLRLIAGNVVRLAELCMGLLFTSIHISLC